MLIIKVYDKNIERSLREYKKKFRNTKVLDELRARREFEKPSDMIRKRKLKVIYNRKKNNDLGK